MPKNIKNIIRDEIYKSYYKEGVADKYAEKEFGISRNKTYNPNTNSNIDTTKVTNITTSSGEYVGDVLSISTQKKVAKVFRNPKTLYHFEDGVDALSDIDGNLYVADVEGEFNHFAIAEAVNKFGKYKLPYAYKYQELVQWYRQSNTNVFALSVAYLHFLNSPQDLGISTKLFNKVQEKFPQFKFAPFYYGDINVYSNDTFTKKDKTYYQYK